MLDYDNDGDLDIYVANYGEWIYPRDAHRCGNDRCPLFCSPWDIRTVKHFLYRNNGDHTFTDVTDRAGSAAPTVTASASSPPTSTATAGSTSTSPTT